MADYYIKSTAYSIVERETKKKGTVYDAIMYVAVPGGELKQRRVVSGCQTKKELKQKQAEFVANYCEIVTTLAVTKTEIYDGTVSDAFAAYLFSLHNQVKDSTIYNIRDGFNLYILPKFVNVKLRYLTKEELYMWQDALWQTKSSRTKEPLSYKYLTTIRGYFNAFLAWCEERYEIPNKLRHVKKPKQRASKSEMNFWTSEEFQKFMSVVEDANDRALFAMLFYTGRRKGEILALSPQNVYADKIYFNRHLSRKTIDDSAYKITSTKADKKYFTPIAPPLKKELANYHGLSPFFFGGEKPIGNNMLRRKFNYYTELAGLPHIRIHDLRHSFVSMCIHVGANYNVIADLIGDSVEQVMKTYGHLYESDKIKVIEMLK